MSEFTAEEDKMLSEMKRLGMFQSESAKWTDQERLHYCKELFKTLKVKKLR